MVNSKIKRKAIERLYGGVCSIYEYREVKDAKTKISSTQEVKVLDNQPCKLSFERITNVTETDIGSKVIQIVKLFISPEIRIKEGSKIIVTQNEITNVYKNTGKPSSYSSHQEIILELFERWA